MNKIHTPTQVFTCTVPKTKTKSHLWGCSAAIFTVCLSYHCCVCAAASAASYSQLKCDTVRSSGHLAACAVVLVLESCCQCHDRRPGLDVTLKEVLWDSAGRRPSKPTAKVPHLHSCEIARGYSAGQHRISQKMASAACSHDDRWQGASCHSRRAHNGSSEGAESLDVSQTLLTQRWKNRASTLAAGSSSSININWNDDWWGWTSWSD